MSDWSKKDLEKMLMAVLHEIVEYSGYYSDYPYLHELLQQEGDVRDFRLENGIFYSHEK